MLTELGLLVRDGPKRATASLASAYEPGEQFPAVGDLSVILDGAGAPLCVIRITDVETRRFGDVDEEFAWTEAEGDRSLAHWRQAHIEFFAYARRGRDRRRRGRARAVRAALGWAGLSCHRRRSARACSIARTLASGPRWPSFAGLMTERDGLHRPVGDVERDDVHEAPGGVEELRAGLAVDLGPPDGDIHVAGLAAHAGEQLGDPVATHDRPRPRRLRAAVVADDHDVRRRAARPGRPCRRPRRRRRTARRAPRAAAATPRTGASCSVTCRRARTAS